MAKRRTRRKTTTRRKAPARRATARANPRRRRRRAPAKRRTTRRRRRRNPAKINLMGGLVAGLGGAAIGGGAYALEGVDIENKFKALILAGGGIALGILASGWSPAAGAGVAGAGAGIGVKMLLDEYMAQNATNGMGRIPGYAYNKFGATPSRPHYYHQPYAQMSAVQADLGAVQANLGQAVYADLY